MRGVMGNGAGCSSPPCGPFSYWLNRTWMIQTRPYSMVLGSLGIDLGLFEDRVQYGTVLPIPRNDEHFPILNTDFGCRIDKCIWLGRRAWEVNKHHKISPLSLHPEHLRLIRSKFMEFPSVFCIINYNGMSCSNLSTTDFSKPQNKTFHDFF
jgi:hypothetical protein